MALEIKQSLRLSQQLVMTPQLQQAIKLLQLNRLELAEVVNQEMIDNPLLEEITDTLEGSTASEQPAPGEAGPEGQVASDNPESLIQEATPDQFLDRKKDDIDWESYIDEINQQGPAAPRGTEMPDSDDMPSFENILTRTTSLEEHLRWQLSMAVLEANEKRLGELIIGNLNDDGYLQANLEDLSRECTIDLEDAEEVLKIIQQFDPIGVASRNLRECLLVQARILLQPRHELVEKIIDQHLPELERKNYTAITKALSIPMDDVVECTKIIRELEPRPGRNFTGSDNTQYITPDIYIYKTATGDFAITLNEDGLPKLRVSSYYKDVLSKTPKGTGSETKTYIQEKLRSAVWLIRSIHNRQKTIFKVTESIVKYQRDFFDKGVENLKPLVLRDVAADIGMHESTVSRVTTNKFVHTPVGIFELKYFFNSGISSADGGGDVASEAVKDKIRQMVAKEDPRKPISDQRIVELLRSENIEIARRTVAKYRDVLGILSSSKRKKPF